MHHHIALELVMEPFQYVWVGTYVRLCWFYRHSKRNMAFTDTTAMFDKEAHVKPESYNKEFIAYVLSGVKCFWVKIRSDDEIAITEAPSHWRVVSC